MMLPEEFLDKVNILVEENHVLLNSQTWKDYNGYDAYEFVTDELVFRCVIMFNNDIHGNLLPTTLECEFEDANFEGSKDLWPGSAWKMTILDVVKAYNLTNLDDITWDQFLGYFTKEFNRNLEEYGIRIRSIAKKEAAKFAALNKMSASTLTSQRLDGQLSKMKLLQQRLRVSQTFRLPET